jgi:hypothetical protein
MLALSSICVGANPGDVVINEVYVNTADFYDGSEYIELHNTTAGAIDLTGWVLSGTEWDGVCGGEHHHEFPYGTEIPAGGYLVIARDVADGDGFEDRFYFLPDLEMYDASQSHEVDDGRVPNTICQNPDEFDDQIRLIPGTSDYSKGCPHGDNYNRYEVLYLYDSPARIYLIDAMEYRYASCTSDQCMGVNVSDNDAYPRYPDQGISLGRDEMSTDTDNSSADFHEEAPTPGAPNVVNLPPEVWSLRYSPCVPKASDNVEVSCYVTDEDGTILSVTCYYNVNGGSFSPVPMSATPPGSLYSCILPPQANQSQIQFYVRAIDDLGGPTTYPGDAPDGAHRYSVGLTAISVIQTVPPGEDSSSVVGQAKNCTGIVTAGRGVYSDYTFVIQDGTGGWSGIYVYDPSASVPAEAGDSVTVSGRVQEQFWVTEISLFDGCYQEHSSGCDVPEPHLVATYDLSLESPFIEMYEGVLVRVDAVFVTNDSLGYGEWEVNDGSGSCVVGDDARYSYIPRTSDVLESLRGVFHYSYGDYKLEPRGDGDIIGPPRFYTLRYTPHDPDSTDVITISVVATGYIPIVSVKLFYSTDDGATFDSTAMASPDSVYTVDIGPYPNDTVVDYYVSAWNSTGGNARKPVEGTYDFRVGLLTIREVQSNRGPDADSSYYAGEPVSVSGIVTAETGVYSDFYFYIQNSYGGGESPEFRGIKIYDRTGTVIVSRGDSVTVSGDVLEYFLETEIAMFFPEAITSHTAGNTVPEPYNVLTASIYTSEAWEGVLVAADSCAVVDPDAGFGQWKITNGGPADTCRVGSWGDYAYQPEAGDSVNVHGIVKYSYLTYILQPRDDDDIREVDLAGLSDSGKDPSRFRMVIAPNPVTDEGSIRFSLPIRGHVTLKVYNVRGEVVRTLVDKWVECGSQTVRWDGIDSRGRRLTSGVYFLRLVTTRCEITKKVVVCR